MGTNYFLVRRRDKDIARKIGADGSSYIYDLFSHSDALHIGKASYGWAFLMATYPKLGISHWKDFIKLFNQTDIDNRTLYLIFDEGGEEVSKEEMLKIMLERTAKDPEVIKSRDEDAKTNMMMGSGSFYDKVHHLWRNPPPTDCDLTTTVDMADHWDFS